MSAELPFEQLEERIRGVATAFPYPPTPDIASSVRRRLASEDNATPNRALLLPRWAWVAVIVALLLVSSLAVPQVQAFVRSILRIGSIEIVIATPTPPMPVPSGIATPVATTTPSPPPIWSWGLAGRTTLQAAQQGLSFTLKLPTYPADLGQPDQVFTQDLGGQAVVLGWSKPKDETTPRMVLYELTSDVMGQKALRDTTQLQETTVNGRPAAWVRGPYALEIRGVRNRPETTIRRLVDGNTLVWEEGGITYRLETTLSLEEAVRIAESLR